MNNDRESTLASGGIDPTFGKKGVYAVPSHDNPGEMLALNIIAVEADESTSPGRIYLGCDETSMIAPFVVRLTAGGELDVDFGKDGYCKLPDLGPRQIMFLFEEFVFSEAGEVTCFGNMFERTTFGAYYFYPAAFRFTDSGELDTSFGKNGFHVYRVPVPRGAKLASDNSIKDQDLKNFSVKDKIKLSQVEKRTSGRTKRLADGKIQLLANLYDEELDPICSYLARINHDGSLDTSFGDQGTVLITENAASPALLYGKASTTDTRGRIAVAGYIGGITVIVRFDAEGRFDQSFGRGGGVRIVFEEGRSDPRGLIETDDRLIVLCAFIDPSNLQSAALIQLMPNGDRDLEFNNGAPAVAELSPNSYVGYDLAIDQGRRLIIAGALYRREGGIPQPGSSAVISRFMPRGMLDETFGSGGYSVHENFFIFRSSAIQGLQKVLTLASEPGTGLTVVARLLG